MGIITEELGCRVISTERGSFLCFALRKRWGYCHSHREDWAGSLACRGAQEAEVLDLRQAVKSSPRGSSEEWKTQRQVTLGPKEGAREDQRVSAPHFLSMDSEDAVWHAR